MFFNKLMGLLSQCNHLLLASACLLCGSTHTNVTNICDACFFNLPILPESCIQCGKFFSGVAPESKKCGKCITKPPPFDLTYALFPYVPPIISLLIKLKYGLSLSHAKFFSEILINQIRSVWYLHQPLPDLILPIPLHAKRLRERGFNQAVEIARPISKKLTIPMDLRHIKRIKYTQPQSNLKAKERQANVAKAFFTTKNYAGLTVAVVDDVITTGNTMTEFCHLLRKANVTAIHVWCCARRG